MPNKSQKKKHIQVTKPSRLHPWDYQMRRDVNVEEFFRQLHRNEHFAVHHKMRNKYPMKPRDLWRRHLRSQHVDNLKQPDTLNKKIE